MRLAHGRLPPVRHMAAAAAAAAAAHPDDFERSDADPRLVAALAAGIAIFLIGSPFLLRVIYPSATQIAGVERDLPPPQPALETKPKRTLHSQRMSEDVLLQSYGWTDRRN